jgi:uncharacterized membrane protein YjgN (DUF898 family)
MDWYYKDGDAKIGPVSDEQMKQLASQGKIKPETKVWNEITSKWLLYSEIVRSGSTINPKTTQPGPPAPEKTEETAWDPYADLDAGDTGNKSNTFDKTQNTRERETTAICADCGRETAWSRTHSTTRGLVCDACLGNTRHRDEPSHDAPSGEPPGSCQFEFTGSGSEYFRIWIVNLLLSIVTLGIYSAWAKVRKNRYFYRNMRVAGSSLDYHGNPIAILKGRIIAFVLLMGLKFSPNIHIALYFIILGVVLGVLPWLITRSFAFRLHNTSWRGIRFRFLGTTGAAAKILYVYGMLIPISAGLCYPLFYQKIRAFIYNNSAFGQTRAELSVGAGPVYRVFIQAVGLALVIPAISAFIISSFVTMANSSLGTMAMFVPIGIFIAYFSILLLSYPFFQARMTNLIWNNVSLGPARFESTQGVFRLAGILIGNFVLTLITLGLYWPWAAVRLSRYRAETMALMADRNLDTFTTDAAADISAAGEEISDAFGFDVSF